MNEEIFDEVLTEGEQVSEEQESDIPAEQTAQVPPDREEELAGLKERLPELYGCNEERYSALRAMGLSPEEAYRATTATVRSSGRSHLSDSTPRRAHSPSAGMSRQTLESARALFEDMSDAELQGLYRRVTK